MRNNRYHTEIRKKIENKGEFKDQTPTQEEREVQTLIKIKKHYEKDFFTNNRVYITIE